MRQSEMVLSSLFYSLEQKLSNDSLWDKSDLLLALVSKILL